MSRFVELNIVIEVLGNQNQYSWQNEIWCDFLQEGCYLKYANDLNIRLMAAWCLALTSEVDVGSTLDSSSLLKRFVPPVGQPEGRCRVCKDLS